MPTYPTPPGLRMAYDRDGSVGFTHVGSGAITALTQAQMEELNDEDDTDVFSLTGSTDRYVGVIFPELRDIVGTYSALWTALSGSPYASHALQTSVDTTNGLDGTWVDRYTGAIVKVVTDGSYRSGIHALSLTGIKGVRIHRTDFSSITLTYRALHIYGEASSGQNPDRLRLWHPTLDQELTGADFDWGDLPQGDVTVKQFRVKNNSATKTASGITVTTSTLFNPNLYDLSTDGTTYAASIAPADLAAGAISPILYVRRTSTGTTNLGLNAVRMHATPTTMA